MSGSRYVGTPLLLTITRSLSSPNWPVLTNVAGALGAASSSAPGARRARRRRAVDLGPHRAVRHAAGLELGERRARPSPGRMQRGLAEPAGELRAVVAQVALLPCSMRFSACSRNQPAPSGRSSAARASASGSCAARSRDVVALVAFSGNGAGCADALGEARRHRRAEQVHLVAGVVDVELALRPMPGRAQQPHQRRPTAAARALTTFSGPVGLALTYSTRIARPCRDRERAEALALASDPRRQPVEECAACSGSSGTRAPRPRRRRTPRDRPGTRRRCVSARSRGGSRAASRAAARGWWSSRRARARAGSRARAARAAPGRPDATAFAAPRASPSVSVVQTKIHAPRVAPQPIEHVVLARLLVKHVHDELARSRAAPSAGPRDPRRATAARRARAAAPRPPRRPP